MNCHARTCVLAASLGALATACANPNAGKAPLVATTAPPPTIQIGRCAGIADLEASKAAGFEYVELGTSDIAKLTDVEFEEALAKHRAVGLPTPVANLFLPADLRIVGPEVDPPRQHDYVELAFARVAKLGVKIVVFGSGKARNVPEGWSQDSGWTQIVDFAKRIAPIAKKNGIVVAVEPLRKQETNIVNSAAQGLKWVKEVNHPNFQLMVDFYHLASENEDPSILLTARDHIKHFHIANPNERVYPRNPSEYDYSGFFANLKKMGFRGGISVEAKTQDFASDAPAAIAFLRAQLGRSASAIAAK